MGGRWWCRCSVIGHGRGNGSSLLLWCLTLCLKPVVTNPHMYCTYGELYIWGNYSCLAQARLLPDESVHIVDT
jgi:hypothetical protein